MYNHELVLFSIKFLEVHAKAVTIIKQAGFPVLITKIKALGNWKLTDDKYPLLEETISLSY